MNCGHLFEHTRDVDKEEMQWAKEGILASLDDCPKCGDIARIYRRIGLEDDYG